MFAKIVHFSVRRKLFVALTTLLLLAGGVYSMLTLPIDAVPDITNNQVQIVTVSPTLAPQEVEQLITFPIEIAMSNVMNVEEIRSVSRFGLSLVTVVFKEDVPTLDARQLDNEQIQMVSGEIPPELGTPELMPITTGLGEIYQYVLKVAPGYEDRYDAMELRTIQDWIVKRQLSGIPGIVEINSFGGYLKQYEVAVDPDALYSLNITIGEVFEALSRNNQNTGGSYIEKVNRAYYIRSEGMINDLKDVEQIVVTNRGGIPVHIGDIGRVQFGAPKRFGAMTKDGEGECVGGIAMMLKGANANVVTKELEKRVAKVQQMLPEGVSVEPYLNRSELVNRNISTVIRNLVEGAIIVFLVLIIFLGNVRAGLIVASVIPLAMLFAFILMRIFNVSANLMSLGAIDFGIVVDLQAVMRALKREESYKTHFLVPVKGDRFVPVSVEQICYFYIDDGAVKAVTQSAGSYDFQQTLDELAEQLNPRQFFRANRQYIVARKAVVGASLWFGGRMVLQLTPPTAEKVIISKARVPAFKEWF